TTSSASSRCSVDTYSSSIRRASSAAWSSTRENAAETFGCCCMPCTDGFPRSVASACARNAAASGTSCCGSSWSSSASSRCSGYSSGLPIRRASSCAAATASCDLSVSLLKSICLSVSPGHAGRWFPGDEVAPVLPVHIVDGLAHLTFHPVEPAVHAQQFVLEPQHVLDARKVEAELVRQALNQSEPVEVGLRVETCVSRGALRADQPLVLVDAQRLRVHADEVGRDGDHVARTVVHHLRPPRMRSSWSSLRRMYTNVPIRPTVPTLTRMTAASFTRRAPAAGPRATASAAPRAPRAPSSSASSGR